MAYILNAEGNFFRQMKRSDPFSWLTCTGVGDIAIPMGDRTPIYCPDPLNSGQFKLEGFIPGVPPAGTYSLVKPLTSVSNWILGLKCEFVGRINWVCRGIRQDPQNYEMAVLLYRSEPSRLGIAAPVQEPEGTNARVNTNADISFTGAVPLYSLQITRQTVVNTAAGNSVFFLPERCEDRCGAARDLCEYGIIGLDSPLYAGYLYDSEIKFTENGGSSWAAAAVDPYTWGGNTSEVLIFETTTGTRWLVFRASQVPAAPAECAYSTDEGASWINVPVGAVMNQAVRAACMQGANVIACCTGGYIYISDDQGASWAAQESGTETVQDLNDIVFYNDLVGYSVGDSNAFLRTLDGGNDWGAVTGPAVGVNLLSVAVNDKGHVFVGTNDGRMFRSENQGTNWTEWLDLTAGTIDWIDFDPEFDYVGFMLHNDATPTGTLYRSEDGGATWQIAATMPTNSGVNSGFICDPNHVALVGEPNGGTTFIAMASPSA